MNTQTREGSATAVAGTSKPLPGLFNRLRLSTPQPARSAEPLTRATALSHLVFERPDVDLAVRFLLDFGLEVASREEDRVFLRAAGTAPYVHVVERGPEPRFVGLGLVVASDADLERLAGLPGASAIETSRRPGGGRLLRLVDPAGFRVEVVTGAAPVEPRPHRAPIALNAPDALVRVDGTQRPPPRPPEITKDRKSTRLNSSH